MTETPKLTAPDMMKTTVDLSAIPDLTDSEAADIADWLLGHPQWGTTETIMAEMFGTLRRSDFKDGYFEYDSEQRFKLTGRDMLEYSSKIKGLAEPFRDLPMMHGGRLYLFFKLNDYDAPGYLFLPVVQLVD